MRPPVVCAAAAYDAMYEQVYDLIVSDIMMPEIDGFEFAKTVRSLNEEIPILFMTARDDFASKQRGYRVGIDDYMVKPIDLDELFLRIGALLRRAKIAASRKLELGAFVMDADEHTAYLNGAQIALTNREFSLLYKLLSYPKKTFTRTQLMDEFWDADTASGPRRVDVYMTNKATSVSLAVGVVGTLILGLGMSCAMVWDLFVPGILIGVAGIVPVALAHPVYKKVLEREKAKIAPKILQLTDELMQ